MRYTKTYQIESAFVRFAVFVFSMIFFCLLAVLTTQLLSPNANGSGIPQLKTILSGVKIYKFLELRVFFAKYLGIMFVGISGVGTGIEGPLIHMSAMIGYNLAKLKVFKKIGTSPFYRNQVMSVAVAAGVTSTFGSPLGGIVFAIELCSTIFLISNFWKLVVCATTVKVLFDFAVLQGYSSKIYTQNVEQTEVFSNIPHYILIGIICGWLGSLWIYLFSLFIQFKNQSKSIIFKK